MSLRTLFVLPSAARAGGVDVVLQYANDLASLHGFETFVTALSGPLGFSHEFGTNFESLSLVDAFEQKFDVVIATHWSTVDVARSMKSERVVHFAQSMEDRFFGASSFLLQQRVLGAQVSLDSITVAPWLERELGRLGSPSTRLVRNPVPELETKGQQVACTEPLIVVEGSWQWFKGWQDAMGVLRRVESPFRVALVSSDGLLPRSVVRRARRDLGRRRVIRHDRLSHLEFVELLRSAEILLKTSAVEGAPLPHIEALLCSCVVITTPATGVELSVGHGRTGLVVEFGDFQGAAALVDLVLREEDLRQELVAGGRRLVEDLPRRRESAHLFAEALSELFGSPHRSVGVSGASLDDAWVRYAEVTFSDSWRSRIYRVALGLSRRALFQNLAFSLRETRVGRSLRRLLVQP